MTDLRQRRRVDAEPFGDFVVRDLAEHLAPALVPARLPDAHSTGGPCVCFHANDDTRVCSQGKSYERMICEQANDD